MDRLHEIEVFIAVAEAGSFAKAGARLRLVASRRHARRYRRSRTAWARAVFNAPPRSLAVTDVGQRLSGKCEARPDRPRQRREGSCRGNRCATRAAHDHGVRHLWPIDACARRPRTSSPDIRASTVSLLLLDRIVNLVEEGIDVVTHRAAPRFQPDRQSGSGPFAVSWSPAQSISLDRGTPMSPTDLRLHAMIAFTGLDAQPRMALPRWGAGHSVTFIRDSRSTMPLPRSGRRDDRRDHHGASYMVADHVREGRLAPFSTI